MIAGIGSSRVESTPNMDPTLGGASAIGQGGQGSQGGERGQGFQQEVRDVLNLSPEAQQQVAKLQQRDREVRAHEQAHISAGGSHVTGGASYTYTRGPDGKQYATGGSVSIDTSPVPGDPDATLEKARTVRGAAMAPGSPSAQDQSVASAASSMEMKARTEKAAATYQAMQNSAAMPTSLAPWGTGIAITV